MNDPVLFSHLMAEITGRFEDLAEKAAVLQAPGRATEASLIQLCTDAEQACHLVRSARLIGPAS